MDQGQAEILVSWEVGNYMRFHIPQHVAEGFITAAAATPEVEVIGWFVARPVHIQGQGNTPAGVFSVDWYPMPNMASLPQSQAEMDARDIARMITQEHCVPLAMIHSHPSGRITPSREDLDFYPSTYVENAYIWCPQHPDEFTWYGPYSAQDDATQVPIDQLFIQADA